MQLVWVWRRQCESALSSGQPTLNRARMRRFQDGRMARDRRWQAFGPHGRAWTSELVAAAFEVSLVTSILPRLQGPAPDMPPERGETPRRIERGTGGRSPESVERRRERPGRSQRQGPRSQATRRRAPAPRGARGGPARDARTTRHMHIPSDIAWIPRRPPSRPVRGPISAGIRCHARSDPSTVRQTVYIVC